jgi:hypothetical protein
MPYPETLINQMHGSVLENAFDNEESDPNFTVQFCDDSSVRVHRFVLKSSSSVLRALVDNGMKETHSGVVTMDDPSHHVIPLLRFLYSGRLPLNSIDEALVLLSVANKYALVTAEGVIITHIIDNFDLRTAVRLRQSEFDRLRTAAQSFISNVPVVILGRHKYQGDIKENTLQGYGILTYDDGSTYMGDFCNNKAHGVGTIISSRDGGVQYQGEFRHGKMHGRGITITASGKRHVGTLENNTMQGRGISILPDGSTYEGEWVNGKLNGAVVYKAVDKTEYDQIWNTDTLISSKKRE